MEKIITLESNVDYSIVKAIAVSILGIVVKAGILGYVVFRIAAEFQTYQQQLLIPTALQVEKKKTVVDLTLQKTLKALTYFNCPKEKIETIGKSIVMSSQVSGIPPVLLVALGIFDETFDETFN